MHNTVTKWANGKDFSKLRYFDSYFCVLLTEISGLVGKFSFVNNNKYSHKFHVTSSILSIDHVATGLSNVYNPTRQRDTSKRVIMTNLHAGLPRTMLSRQSLGLLAAQFWQASVRFTDPLLSALLYNLIVALPISTLH